MPLVRQMQPLLHDVVRSCERALNPGFFGGCHDTARCGCRADRSRNKGKPGEQKQARPHRINTPGGRGKRTIIGLNRK